MVSKLILFPLLVLFFLSLLAVTGLVTGYAMANDSGENNRADSGWADDDNNIIMYSNQTIAPYSNGTAREEGEMLLNPIYHQPTYWKNSSGQYSVHPVNTDPVPVKVEYNLFSSSGLWALLAVFLVIGVVSGVRILGSGFNEQAVRIAFAGGFYGMLWTIFSLTGYQAFVLIPTFGTFAYFGLSAMYTIGVVQTVIGGGGD